MKLTKILFWATMVCLVIARLVSAVYWMPGPYMDELATQENAQAMTTSLHNSHGEFLPGFTGALGGGYITPTYLYPLSLWAKLFGSSLQSIRIFSQIATIAAVAVIAYILYRWRPQRQLHYYALAIGLALPWSWQQGSMAWDPIIVPLYCSLAVYGTLLWYRATSRRSATIGCGLFAGGLIAAAYSYPPCRMAAPLVFGAVVIAMYRAHKLTIRGIVTLAVASCISVIPLLLFMLDPHGMERSAKLSVFSEGIWQGLLQFCDNLWQLISPLFLVWGGDPNIRHAMPYYGMLGFAAIIPLGVGLWMVWQNRKKLFVHVPSMLQLAGIGVLAGYIGSALTIGGQPHSLRATMAWPFIIIVLAFCWETTRRYHYLYIAAVTAWVGGTISYLYVFATVYQPLLIWSFLPTS